MSKKQWFILRVDHHLGPFETDEVLDLIESAKITDRDLLWREGLEQWHPFHEIDELKPEPKSEQTVEEELPELPDLPPLPDEILDQQEDELPPLPDLPGLPPEEFDEADEKEIATSKENLTEPEVLAPKAVVEEEVLDEEFWEEKLEPEENFRPNQKIYTIAGIACSLVIIFCLYFFTQSTTSGPNFYEMKVAKAQEMQAFVKKNAGVFRPESMPFILGLSRDAQSLVLASSYQQPATLYLSLQSIDGEVLAESSVKVEAKAELKNQRAIFDELTWEQGRSLPAGSYIYKVSGVPTGASAILRSALQRYGFAKEGPKPFYGEGKVLLTRLSDSEFEEKMQKFKQRQLQKFKGPFQERMQRYQTLAGLADQILNLYKKIIPDVKNPKDMQRFESRYVSEIGGLLQELIIEAHMRSIELRANEPKEADSYESLREFGKRIGELVSDMMTTTQQTQGLNNVKKERLTKLFENRVGALTKEAKNRLARLDEQLNELKESTGI